ncbi:MAG TPA: hypothetical protein VLL25_10350, partial [Acidimicrobiales bacterium]|nr:hypothetical protein [Acidimicrobiales bacterium]
PPEPTIDSTWVTVGGGVIGDELLDWPPDVFALTDVALERSEAYRFAVSPPAGRDWPPLRTPGWSDAVAAGARHWRTWAQGRKGPLPELVAQEWPLLRDAPAAG